MKRVMLTVAYDGTNYCGWQIQSNGNTIEAELNKHLSELLGEEIKVSGASRTDAGVHALCNLAVFDTNARMPGEKISYGLNQRLPEDIRIQESKEVDGDFHPRFTATKKTYEYRIYNSRFPNPVERLYSHFTYVPLNVDNMQRAAAFFVGEHDFKSFCAVGTQVESTIRTIYECTVEKNGPVICIRVSGNGFLYNMVRIIAGTLMEVGKGNLNPADVPTILEERNRQSAGPTAPAKGLMLTAYEFV
ncbi:MAG: tRNA pseudouridine(38-40) synthase TruA [Lachnospiraceae bacterium]|nr:tRNA pseudouridine(38-40) synthase TruA [Lachnospiraceae bacterium]